MKRRLAPHFLLAGCLLALPGPAFAQDVVVIPLPVHHKVLKVDDFVEMALARYPTLQQAYWEIEAAKGRADQAGRYPNPTVSFNGEEIGKNGGIHTMPMISQEIVRKNKLALARAVYLREVDQAHLTLAKQRLILIAAVRQSYIEVLALQQRLDQLEKLVAFAEQSVAQTEALKKGGKGTELDILQFQVELTKLRAERTAVRAEQIAAWRRLATFTGLPGFEVQPVEGSLDTYSPYDKADYEQIQAKVLASHPDVQIAEVGIARAETVVLREQAMAKPNFTAGVGYQKNFNDREHQATYQFEVPIPIHNRNQGAIRAAQAEYQKAIREVERVRLELAQRLATAYGQYSAAQERAKGYKDAREKAERAYTIAYSAFKGGEFDLLRVLQAQRALADVNMEYYRATADVWRAANDIAGLSMDDGWSLRP